VSVLVSFEDLGKKMGGGGTYYSVDPRRDVALRVAVSGAVCGSAGVECRPASILLHFRKVQSAVHATRQLGDIDVKGEFFASQLQHLVVLLVLGEQVQSRASNVAAGTKQIQFQSTSRGFHAVRRVVLNTLDDAVLGASSLVRAHFWVNSRAGRASERRVVLLVNVVGARVGNEGCVPRLATPSLGALPGGEFGVFLGRFAWCLSGGETQEGRHEERVRCHW
jgi:hypothetical protein